LLIGGIGTFFVVAPWMRLLLQLLAAESLARWANRPAPSFPESYQIGKIADITAGFQPTLLLVFFGSTRPKCRCGKPVDLHSCLAHLLLI
jgi:hypothetical protein